jgi:hypothetical protein
VQVNAAFIADGQTPEAVQPGESAFDHPPVLAEPLTALDATARDTRGDATGAAFLTAPAMIVSLVGVQFARPAAGSAGAADPDVRHGIKSRGEHPAVVAVGAAQRQTQWRAAGVRDEMPLRAWPATVRRVWADLRPPLFAGRLALSSAARCQSKAPASWSCSSKIRCRPAQTPAACHSPSRRQHVLPQHPNSDGSSCH